MSLNTSVFFYDTATGGHGMSTNTIVSYDGTANDDDALALASVLANLGADLTLAYVRHNAGYALDANAAQALLERGAERLGDGDVETRVVINASTAEGLRELATEFGAQLIVFGSEYRTALGRVSPQQSTQRLLENGSTAIAVAPAGYQPREIKTIGLLAGLDDAAAIDTAHSLASALGASVSEDAENVDLLIVGSRPEARQGQVQVSAHAQNAIEGTNAPVLVVARGSALSFRQPAFTA
jgi:nucleotide-binding universal stress UspA family protein